MGVLLGFELLLGAACALSGAVSLLPEAAYVVGFLAVSASSVSMAWAFPPVRPVALVGLVAPAALLALASHAGVGLPAALLVTAALLVGGTLVGGVIGRLVEHPGQLLFVAVVSAAADLASVLHPAGPSATLAQKPEALALIALPWPMLGTLGVEPFLGVGDVVFTALYVASSRRHELSVGRTVVALMTAYAATAALVLCFQRVIPVLPVLGLAIVLAQPSARRPAPADRRRGFVVVAVAVVLVAALLLR